MIIQKSDKGNSVVILDKKFYLEKMNEMLDIKDQLKNFPYKKKNCNFLINQEKKIREPLKELYQLDIIDIKTYDKLCPVGSHFAFLEDSTALRCDSFSKKISKKITCAIMIRIIITFANQIFL